MSYKAEIYESFADTVTPVSIYLALRERFPGSLLLESSDYRGTEDSISFICVDPIRKFTFAGDGDLTQELNSFINEIACESDSILGVFGYTAYSAIPFTEKIDFKNKVFKEEEIPHAVYALFRYVIRIDHFKNSLKIIKAIAKNDADSLSAKEFYKLILPTQLTNYSFKKEGEETSNFNDQSFEDIINKMKSHIARGDVFQIVPSRKFSQKFRGDDFNVYRALRAINPSPYLFYFDYGAYRIFGSSPEAQLRISKKTAEIHPIAGTYLRTGDTEKDTLLAKQLLNDPKENAEHVMLVDLARNDLSKHCSEVKVSSYKQVQLYSHVIHLVSKVIGKLKNGMSTITVLLQSSPAGTLSGAPKYRALELINQYENGARSFYGGSIGYLGFNGDCSHAIMIRTFLSKQNTLFFQAGAGVVTASIPKSEVEEVNNKIAALRAAINKAAELK